MYLYLKVYGFRTVVQEFKEKFFGCGKRFAALFCSKKANCKFSFQKKPKFREKLPLNRGFLGLCGGGFGEVDKKQGWILVKSTKISKIPEWVEFFSEKQVASFFFA